MARKQYNQHATQLVGSNNPAYQISKNTYNDNAHNQAGMLGFTPSTKTLASGVITPTDTVTIIAAETGVTDDFDLIANTEVGDKDVLRLLADAGDTITARHNQTPGGANEKIMLLGAANKVLSETVPLVLFKVGSIWYEEGLINAALTDKTNTFAQQQTHEKEQILKIISTPADPSAGYLKLYGVQLDSNNDSLAGKMKIAGSIVEVYSF